VSGGLTFDELAPGEEYTCAVSDDGVVYCWGSNRGGWLGDGTLDPHTEPTPVAEAA
jgi:alpha-tubulin suppressor-like RCC1 family protein